MAHSGSTMHLQSWIFGLLSSASLVISAATPAPTAFNALNLLSVTFGGADYTDYARSKFQAALSTNRSMTTWSITASTSFFNSDPNPTINKVAVAVWRVSAKAGTNGQLAWSTFKSGAGESNSVLTLNEVN